MAGSSRHRSLVIRQWELAIALSQRRRGMTIQQLVEATGASRATIYRNIKLLVDAGVPLESERINGEVRYKLPTGPQAPLVPTPLQLAALHLARRMMEPLAGTKVLSELDELLRRISPSTSEPDREALTLGPCVANAWPAQVRIIDNAIRSGNRITFTYQSVGQREPRQRCADPICLRYHGGHLYLIAYDTERNDWRTFKLARIHDVIALAQPAEPHPEYDEQALFAHSANVWTGEPIHVSIRLSARVARFAGEWPLSTKQTLEPLPDGSVIVHADVAGTVEAMRWTLRWGQEAEALEPEDLRMAVWAEVAGAAARYHLTPPVS